MYTEAQMERARALGAGRGCSVGIFLPDNTTREEYYSAETGPLSGEYADGLTPHTLMLELGADNLDEWDESELCDAYEEEYYKAIDPILE